MAAELPAALAAALVDAEDLAIPLLEQVLSPGMSVGQAYELFTSVCRVLAEALSTEALDIVRARIPAIASQLREPVSLVGEARVS